MKFLPPALPVFCALLLGASAATAPAADWYVSGTGDDKHAGTSADTAFRTLSKAEEHVAPGDTVLVGDGTYTNGDTFSNSAVLFIKHSGRPDAWITWKAAPGAHPDLRPVGWNGIYVDASYIILDGLSVTGANDAIIFQDALKDGVLKEKDGKKYSGNPYYNTNGIFFCGRLNETSDTKPHHLIVRNCTVSKCPGGGIVGIEIDYFTIEDCLVFDNAWFMRYGGSGITTLNNWAHDDAPGYHNIIQRNRVYNNRTNVPWEVVARLSDGNGILLDVSDQEAHGATNPAGDAAVNPAGDTAAAATPKPEATPAKAVRPEWKGRSLIANNISCFNGGSGIHTFRHKHADIINNTTYSNGHNVGYPEIFANSSGDINILNNVIVPRPTGKVTNNNKNTDLRWDYNLYPVAQTVLKGPHDIVADPGFVKIADEGRNCDFHLQPGSPALDSGTDDVAQDKDLSGQPRPAGKGRDRGAYEQ